MSSTSAAGSNGWPESACRSGNPVVINSSFGLTHGSMSGTSMTLTRRTICSRPSAPAISFEPVRLGRVSSSRTVNS